MTETFYAGELKRRAGTYWRYTSEGRESAGGAVNGIVGCLFRSSWGPLGQVVTIGAEENYTAVYGNSGRTDVMKYALLGGGRTLICCRLGSGGTEASVKIKGVSEDSVIGTIKAKYPGARAFSYSVKDSLANPELRQLTIYEGLNTLETFKYAKGENEADALERALQSSKYFNFSKAADASGAAAETVQEEFISGTDPVIDGNAYSEALDLLEAYTMNTIAADTEETAVHALLHAYIRRIYQNGQFVLGTVAEKSTVELETRMQHAAAFNDECMHYVLNPDITVGGTELDGYQTAAVISGMIAGYPSNISLTHKVIRGASAVRTRLTGSKIQDGIRSGCLVLTLNANGQVWIDTAVNTLVTPSGEKDDGWKSIRRTKTRYELMARACEQADLLVGEVDNDANGRATVVSNIQTVGNTMITEGKLSYCKVTESTEYTSDGNYAYFEIDARDKESAEKLYLTFRFHFSTAAAQI